MTKDGTMRHLGASQSRWNQNKSEVGDVIVVAAERATLAVCASREMDRRVAKECCALAGPMFCEIFEK